MAGNQAQGPAIENIRRRADVGNIGRAEAEPVKPRISKNRRRVCGLLLLAVSLPSANLVLRNQARAQAGLGKTRRLIVRQAVEHIYCDLWQ